MNDFKIDMDSFGKVSALLRGIDEGKGIDTSMPRDLWLTINGVEYHIEMKRSINRINLPPATDSKH